MTTLRLIVTVLLVSVIVGPPVGALGFVLFGPRGDMPPVVILAVIALAGAGAALVSTTALQLFMRPKRSAA